MKIIGVLSAASEPSPSTRRHSSKLPLFPPKWLCCAAIFAVIACASLAAHGQTNQWTWTGGSNTANQPGVYGTLGTPATANTPGSRNGAATATDSAGNVWLFGGLGFDVNGNEGDLNDLWKFNPSTKEWTWIGGSGISPTVIATQGFAAGNFPGGRDSDALWIDTSGKVWLFGGEGYDENGNFSQLNDLWEFDPSLLEWAPMAGSVDVTLCGNTGNQQNPIYCPVTGAYGTLGEPAAGNTPGGRMASATWTDSNGNFWLFGGLGANGDGQQAEPLNDLWEFSISIKQWAWMGGCNYGPMGGGNCGITYGTKGVPAPGNLPGARDGSVGWNDGAGNFWLFGGYGQDSAVNTGYLNDLWEFSPSANEWTWVGGSDLLTCPTQGPCQLVPGTYGTLGVAAPANVPGGRTNASDWKDNAGNVWLYGGQGADSAGNRGFLNDIWTFNLAAGQWTWMGGSNVIPGNCAHGYPCGLTGVYGTLGVAASGNTPGGRYSSASWTDQSGNLWLFGGGFVSPSLDSGVLNDLWEYVPLAPVFAVPAPSFSPAGGTYTSVQTVTLTDASAGASIYYTTDGTTTPTSSSTAYSGPITLSSTQTIEAIAMAPGYSNSAVVTANYIILPPNFSLGASSASLSVNSGGSGSLTLTVTPQNGFNSSVSFACSGLPANTLCSFTPAQITPSGGAAATTQLAITSIGQASVAGHARNPLLPAAGLALAGCIFAFTRRRNLRPWILSFIALAALATLSACSKNSINTGGSGGNSNPITSTVTVTATSGTLQQSTKITLTLN